MSLNERISSMTGEAPTDAPAESLPPDPAELAGEPPPEGEAVQVAGLGRGVRAVREALEPLLKPGGRMKKEPEITKPPADAAAPAGAPQPAPPAAPAPVKPDATPATPAPAAPKPDVRPVPLDEAVKATEQREAMRVNADAVSGKPPDKPFNLDVYDNDNFAATVATIADRAGVDYQATTVRSIYERALQAGVPEGFIDNLLGGKLETTVGNDALAKNFARALTVMDESTKRLDGLMSNMAAGTLDDAGKLQLRQQIAFHELLLRNMKGLQVDVARTMNVFKRVKDAGPGLDTSAVRSALDEAGGDTALLRLAKMWEDTPTLRGKNQLVEQSLVDKMGDTWMYVYQSNLLNGPSTYAVNIAGNAMFGALQPIERLIATGVGKVRTLMPGANPDRYTLEDNYATTHGMINMIMDGWDFAAQSLKNGGEISGLKADQLARGNPLSSDNFSDVPLNIFGQEVWRTPDLRDTFAGRFLDGLGFVQSFPFKVLTTTDEFFGGMASRWKLHSESWTFANKEYDRLVAAGIPDDEAKREVTRQVGQLLYERPAQMQASIEEFRKMITFQTDLSIYRDVPTGEFYWRTAQLFQNPALKVIQPFVKTVTNIWIEGTARTPGLNFISPRFYMDWNKGGRDRDLAVARLALGSSAVATFANLSLENRVTGYGPSQLEDRQALERLGWQPYSLVFSKDELSPQAIEALSKITKVGVGPDKLYVSYARFEPVSMLLAMGADSADAAKFHRGGDWDEDAGEMIKTAAFTASNYMTNLPLMQGIGELIRIGRSRAEDGGEKVVQIFDALAKQYGSFVFTGTPGVGLANSSLVAHVERIMDPTRSNTMPDEMNVPYGQRAFYESLQRLRSRIPGMSAGVPPALDSLGRELKIENRGLDYWANWQPFFTMKEGKRSETDELLVSLDFGINNPSQTWDGVRMSATQYNRYKQLYGQDIKLDGMNLEQYIPRLIKQADEDALVSGEVLAVGDKQKLIMQAVSKYRQLAKLRMLGTPDGEAVSGLELGLSDDKIEFPELRNLIERERTLGRIYGK
jgi:hypothetical protein